MQDKKEYILEKAFEVFMAKGYDSASMTVLQHELKMSRGAMYRYYDSKDDLFIAVVDKYIFGVLDSLKPKFDNENITLAERIELIYQHLQSVGKFLDRIDNMEVKFLNFTAMIIQAAKRYPGFLDKLRKYKDSAQKDWEKAIENSIARGEVRNDVDVKIMATIFTKSINFTDEPNEIGKSFLKGIKAGQKILNYIYSLIKT